MEAPFAQAMGLHSSHSHQGLGICLHGRVCAHFTRLETQLACSLSQAPLLQVSRPSPLPLWPPFTVGNIYQRFTSEAEGLVENIIQLSVPGFLEGGMHFTAVWPVKRTLPKNPRLLPLESMKYDPWIFTCKQLERVGCMAG